MSDFYKSHDISIHSKDFPPKGLEERLSAALVSFKFEPTSSLCAIPDFRPVGNYSFQNEGQARSAAKVLTNIMARECAHIDFEVNLIRRITVVKSKITSIFTRDERMVATEKIRKYRENHQIHEFKLENDGSVKAIIFGTDGKAEKNANKICSWWKKQFPHAYNPSFYVAYNEKEPLGTRASIVEAYLRSNTEPPAASKKKFKV